MNKFQKDIDKDIILDLIKDNYLMQYLYKYRPLNNENTMKIINDKELWFSDPSIFNDPFDCKMLSKSNKQDAELIESMFPNIPLKKGIISKTIQINNPHFNKLVNESIQKVLSIHGICCFSELNNNILMWSHYADSHKGVCLKFDLLSDPDLFTLPIKVKYLEEYPEGDFLKEQEEFIFNMLKSKSTDWEYEREVRIYKQKKGAIKFKKEALKEVIFGCKTEEKDIEEFKTLVIKNGFNVDFYKAKASNTHYRLEFNRI